MAPLELFHFFVCVCVCGHTLCFFPVSISNYRVTKEAGNYLPCLRKKYKQKIEQEPTYWNIRTSSEWVTGGGPDSFHPFWIPRKTGVKGLLFVLPPPPSTCIF